MMILHIKVPVRDTSAGRGKPGDLAAESYVLVVAPCSPCCVREAAVFCDAMASGGWPFTTILRTLGGPARGVVSPGRYASGAGSTVAAVGMASAGGLTFFVLLRCNRNCQ